MHDRKLADRSGLYATGDAMAVVDRRTIQLTEHPQRPARVAQLELRFGAVALARPQSRFLRHLPKQLPLALVDVCEVNAPAGAEPLRWRLLTSHEVTSTEDAWRIVGWYKQRWIIEQFFRVLKTQGFQIEDSQIDSADILLKLIAVAAKAAAITIQLLQARDGRSDLPASAAFDSSHIPALAAINARYETKTARQKNPYPYASMAWAAWIIARLGGWDGYRSSRPPGPITFKHGLDQFHAIALGWELKDVSTP